MTFPSSATRVVVKGYWWTDDGSGVTREVSAEPSVDHVTSLTGKGVIDLERKVAVPEDENPYWEIEVVASNDADLSPAFSWTFRFSGYDGAWTVTVPFDAVTGSDGRPEVWLVNLTPLVSPPTPAASYYTKSEVDALFTQHIGLSTPNWDPHPQYQLDTP